jgi:hypothetical protein
MMAVPDEAVEAAQAALDGWRWPGRKRAMVRDLVRVMLEAAEPHMTAELERDLEDLQEQYENVVSDHREDMETFRRLRVSVRERRDTDPWA